MKYILLLIPVLGRHRHAVLCELQASLGYIVSSSPARLHSKTLSKEQPFFFLNYKLTVLVADKQDFIIFPFFLEWKCLLCCIIKLFGLVSNTLGAVLGARRVAENSKSSFCSNKFEVGRERQI